jgi:hypothetical protein
MVTKKATNKTISAKAMPKKPTAKKPAEKKLASQKPSSSQMSTIRRPDPNLPPTPEVIENITNNILELIEQLDSYTANLRALDRMRHNGVGLKRLGFIEAAFRLSTKFPQYFPHWLDTAKFQSDLDLFNAIRSLVEVCRSLEEKAWNINVESSDMIYTNALEYYSQVQDAANRRIDSAESIYAELHGFFRRGPMESDQPTKKQLKRDINALERGTKDGEVIIRNIKPKTSGGKHEVIDETFKNKASFKETEEGNITE